MQDTQVLTAVFQHVILQDIHILHTFILFEVGEAFALYTRHIQNVRLVDDVFRKFRVFIVFDAMLVTEVFLFVRHAELVRRDEVECRVEMRHSHYQRVYGTSVFQVADHRDVEIRQSALCLLDGIEVQHGLGGMLVCPVSGIDDWYVRDFRRIAGSTFQMMTHNDKIDIVAYHQDGIFQSFAFGGTGRGSIGETDHTAAQAVHCSLETQACASGGFEEQGRRHFPFQQLTVRICFKLPGVIQNTKNVLFGTLIDRN